MERSQLRLVGRGRARIVVVVVAPKHGYIPSDATVPAAAPVPRQHRPERDVDLYRLPVHEPVHDRVDGRVHVAEQQAEGYEQLHRVDVSVRREHQVDAVGDVRQPRDGEHDGEDHEHGGESPARLQRLRGQILVGGDHRLGYDDGGRHTLLPLLQYLHLHLLAHGARRARSSGLRALDYVLADTLGQLLVGR